MTRNPVGKLLLFGATGDLAQRMLLPSLYGLQHAGLLPAALRILGTARSEMDDAAFRDAVAEAVRRQVPAADLDEAAERDGRDLEQGPRLLGAPAEHRRPEADAEALDAHVAQPRDDVVPRLVDDDQEPDRDDRSKPLHVGPL